MKPFLLGAALSQWIAISAVAGSATWNLNPTSADWNTAANWTPATVPNGANDTATFAISNTTALSLSKTTKVNGIIYNSGASAFTTTIPTPYLLTFSGAGIINNSDVTQTFVAATSRFNGIIPIIFFSGSATAGKSTNFIVEGARCPDCDGAEIHFQDTSSADQGFFTVSGGMSHLATAAIIYFEDASTAANSTFICNNDFREIPCVIVFEGTASLGNGTFTFNNGCHMGVGGANSIGDAVFTVNGDTVINGSFQSAAFVGAATVGKSIFTTNGGTASGAIGGYTAFNLSSDAGNSTIVANGGTDGVKEEKSTFSTLPQPAVPAWRFSEMRPVASATTTLRGFQSAHSKEMASFCSGPTISL